jgi:hypothetical protein
VPGPALLAARLGTRLLGGVAWWSDAAGPHLRYGFTLDTRRAELELGFRPSHRIGLARAGDGALTLETAAV